MWLAHAIDNVPALLYNLGYLPDMKKPSKTNWAYVEALTDQTIDTSDIPPLTEAYFARAKLRLP
jgi:hypothetical protein